MKKMPAGGRAGLSPRDRKVLEKYADCYTNFIESSTAKPDINDDQVIKARK